MNISLPRLSVLSFCQKSYSRRRRLPDILTWTWVSHTSVWGRSSWPSLSFSILSLLRRPRRSLLPRRHQPPVRAPSLPTMSLSDQMGSPPFRMQPAVQSTPTSMQSTTPHTQPTYICAVEDPEAVLSQPTAASAAGWAASVYATVTPPLCPALQSGARGSRTTTELLWALGLEIV